VKGHIRVILIGRNKAALDAACAELGVLAVSRCFDLADLSGIPTLVAEIKKIWGTPDILINNAGIHLKKPLLETTDAEFQQVVQTNQTAVFALSREVARTMAEQGRGSIIHISSMASQYGIPNVVAYTASKAAVEGMTRAMAVELAPLGIRVNCIAPGFIATAMSARAMDSDPARRERVLARTPLHRFGTPEEVAETAFYLAGDGATYVTGTVIPVDGGNSIGF
jgi:NAD(P)-dependent dehydrogenase (short-subunit alcohol dehydrogenase family)